jgi:hypothetical protein
MVVRDTLVLIIGSFPDRADSDPFAAAPTVQWSAMAAAQGFALARDEAALVLSLVRLPMAAP